MQSETGFSSKLDLVYISYSTPGGKAGILALNFTTGSINSIYNLNNNISNFKIRAYSSALQGYYTECCDVFYKFHYDFLLKPKLVCLDNEPVGKAKNMETSLTHLRRNI